MAESQRRREKRTGLAGGRYRQHSLAERLAARTVKGPNCWEIQGYALRHNGYVQIAQGKGLPVLYAHRAAWELAHGPIAAGQSVCHTCDNPRCVNPTHLFLGTQRDNIRDAVRKGRWTVRKLTDDDVAQIRSMAKGGMLQREIAAVYGVARNTVSAIVTGAARVERIGEPLESPNVEPVRVVFVPVRGVLHVGHSTESISTVPANSVVLGSAQ